MKKIFSISLLFFSLVASPSGFAQKFSNDPVDVISLFTFFKDQIAEQKCSASFETAQGPLKSLSPTRDLILQLHGRTVQKSFREGHTFLFGLGDKFWSPNQKNDEVSIVHSVQPRNGNLVNVVTVRLGLVRPQTEANRSIISNVLYLEVEYVGTKAIAFNAREWEERDLMFCGRGCRTTRESAKVVAEDSCLANPPAQ